MDLDRRAAVAGTVAALLTALVLVVTHRVAGATPATAVLGGLLWLTVGIYLGMALMDGPRALRHEALGGLPTLLLATAGMVASPWWLVAGWLTHPGWDLLHRPGPLHTRIHRDVVPFCLTYDVLVAGVAAGVALAGSA